RAKAVRRRRLVAKHAEACRCFLERDADQCWPHRSVVPGCEPCVDMAGIQAHARHGGEHVFDRMSRVSVRVFFARKSFFLVIENQSWPALARQLDERNTGIMEANRRYTGQI